MNLLSPLPLFWVLLKRTGSQAKAFGSNYLKSTNQITKPEHQFTITTPTKALLWRYFYSPLVSEHYRMILSDFSLELLLGTFLMFKY